MLRLYGDPRSRAFRCIWMLEELDVEYEVVPTGWTGGEDFGVADLNVAVMLQRPQLARVDRRPFPNLQAWLKRCRGRVAFRRMIEVGQRAGA